MSMEASNLVDWEMVGTAMKRIKPTRRHWVAKHTSGYCGTNAVLFKWKMRDTDACPRCDETEDPRHVWLCTGMGAQDVKQDGLDELEEWLRQQETAPDIITAITSKLRTWLLGTTANDDAYDTPGIDAALDTQDAIGWGNFFEGCLSTHWRRLQHAHYQVLDSHRSSRRWTTALIRKLWDIAWDLWEHRNGILHNQRKHDMVLNMSQVDAAIREEYIKGTAHLPQTAHFLFSTSLDDVLSQDASQRKAWLASVTAARSQIQALLSETQRAERQLMRNWLGRQEQEA